MQVACKLHIVHIDERAASRQPAAQSDEYYHRVRALVQTLDSQYDSVRVCCLEDAFGVHRSPDAKLYDLQKMLASSTDDTSRQDVVRALRQRVLLAQAKELECNKLLLADNSTGLAARFVSMTAQVCHNWAIANPPFTCEPCRASLGASLLLNIANLSLPLEI